MSVRRFHKMRDMLMHRQPDLTVVMDQVHKPHNLAAIMRSADAVGVDEVHAIRAEGHQRFRRKAASGSNHWVTVHQYDALEECLPRIREQGMQILAADFGTNAVPFREAELSKPTALLLGQELDGLSEKALAKADGIVTVPTIGMIESLNVSVAAALILFEAHRQRLQAGSYDKPKLPLAEIRNRLFRWTHPKVAEFCHRHRLDYPELDEDGDIIGELPRPDRDRSDRLVAERKDQQSSPSEG